MSVTIGSRNAPAAYDGARPDIYALLSVLLLQPPSVEVRQGVAELQVEPGNPRTLEPAVAQLRSAAQETPREVIEQEFQRLFIGISGGLIMPFASWYLEKRLMSHPLVRLRGDLHVLGLRRREGICESEDHAGVLCEIMARLCSVDDGRPPDAQRPFFQSHLGPWLPVLFRDLRRLAHTTFYKAVGSLGVAFMDAEQRFLCPFHPTGEHQCRSHFPGAGAVS